MSVSQTIEITAISKVSPRSIPWRTETTTSATTDAAKLRVNDQRIARSSLVLRAYTGARQRKTRPISR
jgi:Flp pilus assembly protein CpaB